MSYAGNVGRTQDTIASLTRGTIDNYDDLAKRVETAQAGENQERAQEYTDKYKEIQELGADEISAYLGAKGLYTGYKKVKSLAGKGKELADQVKAKVGEVQDSAQDFVDSARGKIDDLASSARDGLEDLGNRGRTILAGDPTEDGEPNIHSTAQEDADNLGADADEFEPTNIPEGAGGRVMLSADKGDAYSPPETETSGTGDIAETSFGGGDSTLANVGKTSAEDIAKSVGESSLEDAGETIAGDLASTSVLDAIPVIGEGAAVVGGLVAIGDGIAHLFKHHSTAQPIQAPPPPPVSSFTAPDSLTSKYASAIPSLDTAIDRSGSYTNF
jgi:gas vesicle protein